MRIGLMLRSMDEKGGIGVYTSNLVHELLCIDHDNDYILFYRNSVNLGRFSSFANVTERVVSGQNKLFWDQVAIPYACWREKVDVVLHPKFTVPLLAPCKTVMVVHGADWFIPEQAKYYSNLDVRYIRAMMPLYFKKCAAVISVSQLTTENFNRALALPPGKIKTIYFGPARHFHRITDPAFLHEVNLRYNLPDEYIFTLTKTGGEGRKNLDQLLHAYAIYHQRSEMPHKLVIGGVDGRLLFGKDQLLGDGLGSDIIFPGWIKQEDLPAIYSQADLYLYPSNLEAFPIPITEAMACGTPIVTSNVNGLREIAGDAALLVDPQDPEAISDAIQQVLSDPVMQSSLTMKGLARSKQYTWDSCAKDTLSLLESLA